MTEFTKSYKAYKGTIARTIVYTFGHFVIAASTVMYFTGADFWTAMTNAIVEPILNAIWYFVLDALWTRRSIKKRHQELKPA
jgi:uncharacterized membrane protein